MDTQLPKAQADGYGASALPLSHLVTSDAAPFGTRSGIPSIVYFSNESKMEKSEAFEEKLFGDERVGFASQFLNCYRISLDDIPSKKVRARYGAKGPMVILLGTDGEEITRYSGWGTTGARVFKDLKAVVKARYQFDLGKAIRREAAFLKALDKAWWVLEDLRWELGELEKRQEASNSKSAARQITKLKAKIAEAEKALEAARKKEQQHVDSLGVKV